jgi:hypothetical protein
MVEGRLFTDQDTKDAPDTAIVDEAFVQKFWPGQRDRTESKTIQQRHVANCRRRNQRCEGIQFGEGTAYIDLLSCLSVEPEEHVPGSANEW